MSKRPLCMFALTFLLLLTLLRWGQMKYLNEAFSPALKEQIRALQYEELIVTGRLSEKRISQGKLVYYLEDIIWDSSNTSISDFLKSEPYFKQNNKIICTMSRETKYAKTGSIVCLRGMFMPFLPAENEGQFDAKAYYGLTGYVGRMNQTMLERICDERHMDWLAEKMLIWKWQASTFLQTYLNREEASVVAAMVLGEKADLDEQIKSLYQKNGIAHVLAISGLHIAMLGMAIFSILRALYIPPGICNGISICTVLLYAKLTGFSSSVIRAVTMFLLLMLADLCHRTYDMLTGLAIALMVVLVKNPYDLSSAGFLLSFSAVCAIAIMQPFFRKNNRKEKVAKLFFQYMISPLEISFWITIFTLPIQLWFYYAICPYGIFLNLLVVPIATVLVPVSFLAILSKIPIILLPVAYLLRLLEMLCNFVQALPFAQLVLGRPRFGMIVLYYGLLAWLVWGFYLKKEKKWGRWRNVGVYFLMLACMVLPLRQTTAIDMLSIGQGDCVVLRTLNRHCVIFDAGSSSEKDVGKYKLIPFLKYNGIRKVDAIFVSHSHIDHTSAVYELLENARGDGIHIFRVVVSQNAYQKGKYEELEALAREKKVEVSKMKQFDVLANKGFSVVCAYEGEARKVEDENDTSMVLLATIGNMRALMTGDSTKRCDSEVLDGLAKLGIGHVDYLKVAHHGSMGATSEELLRKLTPNVAMISCGYRNKYSHPHEETLVRLKNAGCYTYCTKDLGQIRFEKKRLGWYVKSYPFFKGF